MAKSSIWLVMTILLLRSESVGPLIELGNSDQVTGPRVISRTNGRLADKLKPEDSDLIIEDRNTTPMMEVKPPDGMSQVEWYLHLGASALVVSVEAAEPRLTPREDWIRTTYTARVTEVYRVGPKDSVEVGQQLSWARSGGQMHIAGKRVTARPSLLRDIVVGGRYLAFAYIQDGTEPVLYRILDGGRLEAAERGPADSMSALSIKEVAGQVAGWISKRGK